LNDKVQKLLTSLKVLPPSPALLSRLLPILSDVDGNFDEVIDIISLEQSLTAKLLQLCNTAFFGQSEPVSTVVEAVNRMGYQSVYMLVAVLNGSASFPWPSPKGIDASKLWRHSVLSAFSSRFAAETAHLDSNLAFTAGLMHDIGKVILCQVPPTNHPPNFTAPTTAASLEHELAGYGVTHAEVGAALLERWKLPAQLAVSVRYHHDPKSAKGFEALTACVTAGNLFTHSELHPKVLESPEFATALEILHLDNGHLPRWRKKMDNSQEFIDNMSRLPLL
jgi:putative nucleotidyltransferase with HDIG domain